MAISNQSIGYDETIAEAKRLAVLHKCKVFVYQTGPDSFNFCFHKDNRECGMLVARFGESGESIGEVCPHCTGLGCEFCYQKGQIFPAIFRK